MTVVGEAGVAFGGAGVTAKVIRGLIRKNEVPNSDTQVFPGVK